MGMENAPRYNSTLAFETFPFPAGLPHPQPFPRREKGAVSPSTSGGGAVWKGKSPGYAF
jgi:hypothetical protein